MPRHGETFDVAICGLGPVGATLASLLGRKGVRTLAFDAAPEIHDSPRAIGMDHEVMRVFQEAGIADHIAQATRDYRDSEYRTAEGKVIRRFVSPPRPWPLSWPPYQTFVQPLLEGAIRTCAAGLPAVDMRTSLRLDGFDEDPTGVTLRLANAATGAGTTARARYLVGADGGSSFVRRSLGIAFEDLNFDEPWLVVDLRVNDDGCGLPDVNVQFCEPERPHTFVMGPGNLRRFEFMLNPGEDPAEMARDASVWRLLEPWIGPDRATLWRAATYRFHALVARDWRRGRVFLAGDACHMTPPFLAQGMVQGIKDASNLGWKLAAACRGADDAILDTYEAERRPLVREVIAITKDLGRVICERDPGRAAERDARMLAEMEAGRGVTVRQSLFPPLSAGPLVRQMTGTAAGRPAPQPVVATSGKTLRLDDLTGPGFRLLSTPGFLPDADARQRLDALGIPCVRIGPGLGEVPEEATVFRDWMAEHGAAAILVRPDHMVMAGLGSPEDLAPLLEDLSWMLRPA